MENHSKVTQEWQELVSVNKKGPPQSMCRNAQVKLTNEQDLHNFFVVSSVKAHKLSKKAAVQTITQHSFLVSMASKVWGWISAPCAHWVWLCEQTPTEGQPCSGWMTIIPAGGKKYKAKSKFVGTAEWNWAGSALLLTLLKPLGPKCCKFCTLLGSELFVEGRKETRWKNRKSKAHV